MQHMRATRVCSTCVVRVKCVKNRVGWRECVHAKDRRKESLFKKPLERYIRRVGAPTPSLSHNADNHTRFPHSLSFFHSPSTFFHIDEYLFVSLPLCRVDVLVLNSGVPGMWGRAVDAPSASIASTAMRSAAHSPAEMVTDFLPLSSFLPPISFLLPLLF